jgi:hypothetical protein
MTHNVEPIDLEELLTLADKAFRVNERDCSYPGYDRKAHKARLAVEHKARQMGCETFWDGLYPRIERNGRPLHLPTV